MSLTCTKDWVVEQPTERGSVWAVRVFSPLMHLPSALLAMLQIFVLMMLVTCPLSSQAMAESSTPLETEADCEVNSCVVVRYPDRCYPGVVTEYIDKDTRRIRFLHPHTTKKTFFVYPAVADVQLVSMDMIIATVGLVPTCNSMREWRVEGYDF